MESRSERELRGALDRRLARLEQQMRVLQRVRSRRVNVDDERWLRIAIQLKDAVVRLDSRVDNLRAQALAEVGRLDQRISQVRDQALARILQGEQAVALLDARVTALEQAVPPSEAPG